MTGRSTAAPLKSAVARQARRSSLVWTLGLGAFGLAFSLTVDLPVIFAVAIAGGLVLTLAWGLLYSLMPEEQRGTAAGLATTTKGIGLITGPLVVGGAIDIFGYRTLWPLCGLPILLAIPLVASLRRRDS